MSAAIDTSEITSNLATISKEKGCHISVTKLAIQKAEEVDVLRNELLNVKLQKYNYQVVTAGLAVTLIGILFIIYFFNQ